MSALDKIVASQQVALAAGDGDDYSTAELVEATDAALDEACRIFSTCDSSQCPPEVRQAINLVLAASVTIDGVVDQMKLPDPDALEFTNWVESHTFDQFVIGLAKDASKPYGDVTYADPGYQSDGKKRYPVDNPAHIRAAWSYINQGDNSSAYNSVQLSAIKNKIKAAAAKAGIQIADTSSTDSKKVAASAGKEHLLLLAMPSELASAHHEAFHGTHVHPHTHLGDNHHGPDMHDSLHGPGGPLDHGMMPPHNTIHRV